MSTGTETRENQVPPEVAALWTQLHAEAIRRRDDLKPATSRRWLAAVGAIAIGVVALVIVGALIARQSDQRRTEATITAVAVAAATTQAAQQAALETRETQVAATATADWNALQERQAETATALASATEATATEAAKVTGIAQETATAVAITTATAIACLQDELYSARVSDARNLSPEPGATVVIGGNQGLPLISASWVITNTGQCPWESLELRRSAGPSGYDAQIASSIAPGEETELTIQFTELPINPVDAKWYIVAKGKVLLERGGEIILAVPTWVIPQTATPTPTYTPTPTPTPTATPTPRLGNLVAKEPQSQRYMSDGVVFEWTYDTELESFFRFQILARGPGNAEYPLAVPGSCEPYEPQGNNHRCTVRNDGLLPADGSYTWSVRVIDAADQVQGRESNTLSFDLSRQPAPADTPAPEPTSPSVRPTPTP